MWERISGGIWSSILELRLSILGKKIEGENDWYDVGEIDGAPSIYFWRYLGNRSHRKQNVSP